MKIGHFTLLVIIIITCGCGSKDFNRFSDIEGGFSLDYPKIWIREEKSSYPFFIIKMPNHQFNSSINPNITVIVDKSINDIAIEEYTMQQIKEVKKVLPNTENISLNEKIYTNISGEKALKIVYEYNFGITRIKIVSHGVIKNRKGYIITGVSEKKSFPILIKVYDKVIESMKIK